MSDELRKPYGLIIIIVLCNNKILSFKVFRKLKMIEFFIWYLIKFLILLSDKMK